MPKTIVAFAGLLLTTFPAQAHITPNVELVRRGEFLKSSLPGATKFFQKEFMISGADGAEIRRKTGWAPSEEDTRVYVGRDSNGRLVGTVVFLWVDSQHGPLGIAAAFDPSGTLRRAAVTDVASEPLAWVRPLIDAHGPEALAGLAPGSAPDPSRIAPAVSGSMSRYYAGVIAAGVRRAQAVEALVRRTRP